MERLVRLKNADPELFTQAWNRLPESVRENILSYLKRYPKLLEGEYPLLLLHRAGGLSKDEVQEFEGRVPSITVPRTARPPESAAEKLESAGPPVRRRQRTKTTPSERTEWPSLERSLETRLVREPPSTGKEDMRSLRNTEADSLLLAELRKISRQNKTQIGLMRRLVESSKGKSRTGFSFSKDR